MRKVFPVAIVAVVGGCSLFGFDGFSGGDVPAEAGADQSSTSDAPNVPANDANATSDAGGDATSGPFCKTSGAGASVCDDFEEPGTFTGKWPEQERFLGTLDLKDGVGIGGTRGLQFSATPEADNAGSRDSAVRLGWETPNVASYVDAEVAVKVSSVPAMMTLAGPLYLQMDAYNGGYARLGFLLGGNRVLSTSPVVFPPTGPPIASEAKDVTTLAIGVWTRIRLVVDLAKSPAVLFAYVDGSLKHEQTIIGFAPAKVFVRIGAQYVDATNGGTIAIYLDDAKITWK